MKFTKQQVSARASEVRAKYRDGRMTPHEIKQYESLPNWRWKINKTLKEHVVEAEQLTKKHGGILPYGKWMERNGFNGLTQCIRKNPEAFLHLKRDKKTKTIEEWVAVAEQLVKKRGTLPCRNWLNANGYTGLDHAMRNDPAAFRHITRDKKQKTCVEWVCIAEKLAKAHGGTLPCYARLAAKGYGALLSIKGKNIEAFAHIPQDSNKGKTPFETVRLAEKLAQQHEGILPNKRWLRKNGHGSIEQCMRKHSQMFVHIQQNRKRRALAETVALAEQFARTHKGILPNRQWLRTHGHGALYAAMRNHPRLFRHIAQMKLDTGGNVIP